MRLKKTLPKLKVCNAAFIVVSPGPRKELKSIQTKTEFPYPFIEDRALYLAKKLSLVLGSNQIQPVMFEAIVNQIKNETEPQGTFGIGDTIENKRW